MQKSAQLKGIKYCIMKYKVLCVAQISGFLEHNEDNRIKKKARIRLLGESSPLGE